MWGGTRSEVPRPVHDIDEKPLGSRTSGRDGHVLVQDDQYSFPVSQVSSLVLRLKLVLVTSLEPCLFFRGCLYGDLPGDREGLYSPTLTSQEEREDGQEGGSVPTVEIRRQGEVE